MPGNSDFARLGLAGLQPLGNFTKNRNIFSIPKLGQQFSQPPNIAPSLVTEQPELAQFVTGGQLSPEVLAAALAQQKPVQQQQPDPFAGFGFKPTDVNFAGR